jgi:hypothetical protein
MIISMTIILPISIKTAIVITLITIDFIMFLLLPLQVLKDATNFDHNLKWIMHFTIECKYATYS